jgi:hypothetical protein
MREHGRSTRAALAWGAAVALLVGGCAQTGDKDVGDNSGDVALVNLWRVSGAVGETPNTWLRLDASEFQLWRDCGMLSGSWAASGTRLVASVDSANDACAPGNDWTKIGWLDAATSYRRTTTGFALVSRDGHDVATLTVDGAPKPIDTVDDPYAKPPVVTEAVRQAFQPPKAVPAKLTPATSAMVTGTWVPATGAMATNPHATFAADGSWTGTDGCNGGGGRWAIDAGGRFLTTASLSTAIGCDGAPIPAMVTATTRMAFDGATLVLLGRDGREEGRLARG